MADEAAEIAHLRELERRAERRAELRRLRDRNGPSCSLSEYILKRSPHLPPPKHLNLLISKLEEATRRPIRLALSMPPRHAKTNTILHAIPWWMEWSPADSHAYTSFNSDVAKEKSSTIRDLAIGGGIKLREDASRLGEWRNKQGGGLLAAGLRAGITSKGVNALFIVDDPFKNRIEANSRTIRNQVYEGFREVVQTRLEEVRHSASIIVVHTRWHPDDLIGRLAKDGDFEILNIPALAEENDILGRAFGEALWEEMYPRVYLEELRQVMGVHSFDALYQGRPRPKGAKLFGPPTYYDPDNMIWTGCKSGIGADPAATDDTSADYSAAVAGRFFGRDEQRKLYIRDVYRKQVTIPTFVTALRMFQAANDGSTAKVEAAGIGRAVVQMLKAVDHHIRVEPVEVAGQGDKFLRMQPVAAAWNSGRVLVPAGPDERFPWRKEFLEELEEITGVGDEVDDQGDALTHLWDGKQASGYKSPGHAGNRRI